MYTDLTSSGIYSISDDFKNALDDLFAGEDKDTHVNIVLMSEEDRYANSSTEANYLYHTFKQIEEYSDRIRVVGVNSTRDKERISRYQVTDFDTTYTNDVVFEMTDAESSREL